MERCFESVWFLEFPELLGLTLTSPDGSSLGSSALLLFLQGQDVSAPAFQVAAVPAGWEPWPGLAGVVGFHLGGGGGGGGGGGVGAGGPGARARRGEETPKCRGPRSAGPAVRVGRGLGLDRVSGIGR